MSALLAETLQGTVTQEMKKLTVERTVVLTICQLLDSGVTQFDIPALIRIACMKVSFGDMSSDLNLIARIQDKWNRISNFWTKLNS